MERSEFTLISEREISVRLERGTFEGKPIIAAEMDFGGQIRKGRMKTGTKDVKGSMTLHV